MTQKVNEKLNIQEILQDLENYRPRRKGWTWRKPRPGTPRSGPLNTSRSQNL